MDISLQGFREPIRQKSDSRSSIPIREQLKLWVAAAGRCSFPGCHDRLDIDSLTMTEINHANIAHIVAAKKGGPRGNHPLPLNKRCHISNLILVCTKCHKLVDDKTQVSKYTVEKLIAYKVQHESRMEYLTDLSPKLKTTIVRCRANIQDEIVQIPFDDIQEAVEPMYPTNKIGIEIDLTKTPADDSPVYWMSKKREIRSIVDRILSPSIATNDIDHLSVFALGPIPLLMHLGNCLSNKVPTELFQRHRHNEKWAWKKSGKATLYKINNYQAKNSGDNVALILSLSGSVARERLPTPIRLESPIFEITLLERDPSPTYLNTKDCLRNFRLIYRDCISQIMTKHPKTKTIHMFCAVPAPIAVLCGRELLHKADPTVAVYDFDKNEGGFKFAMEINDGS
jgi:hypothetical protein